MSVAVAQTQSEAAQAAVHARVRGVTRVFEGKLSVHALGPLDLDLARGEFFARGRARPAAARPR